MGNLQWLKPGVSLKTHLLIASLLWTVVGGGLLWVGIGWALPRIPLWLIALAIALGTLKSLFVLDRVAGRNIARLFELPEKSCIGGVYSFKMWLLVGAMVIMGRLLRASAFPREFVGVLYVVVGWALLLSSRIGWRNWSRLPGRQGNRA